MYLSIYLYKVPERLQPEVERQLKEMLAHGIIRESNSPMASPLVCVLKGKDGCDGVRLAVDYRYVNQFTVSDACLLYTSPSPRDGLLSRMPSSA